MTDNTTESNCPVMNGTAQRHTTRLIRGTRPVWLVALALGCWAGTLGGMVLAQNTPSIPLAENSVQSTNGKCPVTGHSLFVDCTPFSVDGFGRVS